MEEEIAAALGNRNPEEILSSAFKLKVTRKDIRTLEKLQWLNDTLRPRSTGSLISTWLFWWTEATGKKVIDVRKKSVRHYDSLGQNGAEICQVLLKFLQEESLEKRKVELDCSEWTLCTVEPHEIPQQKNGSDCGVSTCQCADGISREEPVAFPQGHMPDFCRKMVWEIIHQQLL
ncbi:sentrin-specific protease 2-like [Porphyrio hochstetteri]